MGKKRLAEARVGHLGIRYETAAGQLDNQDLALYGLYPKTKKRGNTHV